MKKVGVITALLGMLLTMVWPKILSVAQDSQAVIRFVPTALGLRPDTQGTVNVLVENVQNLYGLEFQISFDPSIVEVIDANTGEDGVQIHPAEWWKDGFVAVNKVDNGSGRIDFAATLLKPARAVNGKRAIAAITFAARKTGTSKLRFESAILSTREAIEIHYTKQTGKIGVNPSGKAPDQPAKAKSAGPGAGRLALAGAGALAFLAALGAFIFALRRR